MTGLPPRAICLVTDRRRLAPSARTLEDELAALERQIDEAVGAGVDMLQIRERDVPARALAGLAGRVISRARASGSRVRVLVNDRADVALASEAHGVHLRAEGPSAERVRGLRPSWLVGRSIHRGDPPAPARNADYLFFGPVFPTASKPGADAAGLDALAGIAAACEAAVFAIGGMTPERAAECCRRGAAGVAAIGLFLPSGSAVDALGPARAVGELRRALAGA